MQLTLARKPRTPTVRFSDRQRATLLAAARPVTTDDAKDLPKLRQGWQETAYGYFDRVGACHFPAAFHGAMLSRVRLYVGFQDESGEIIESEDPAELALLDPLADQDGGHRTILNAYGQQMFIAGETSLVITADEDNPGVEQHDLLSPVEWRVTPDGKKFMRSGYPGERRELLNATSKPLDEPLLPGEARSYRLWRRHPGYSLLADSPVRPVLDQYEELMLLGLAARSRILSRLVQAGVLFYDGEISFAETAPDAPDEDPDADPFFERLIAYVQAAISDPGSAAAAAPLLARVDSGGRNLSELFFHLKLVDDTGKYPETERQRELIHQVAIAIDLPPEILEGMGGISHWGGWLVDEQTWKNHGQPNIVAFCSDMTSAYLRPRAVAQNLTRAADLVIWYDAAAVTTDPDKSKTAQQAYVDGAVGGAYYRDSIGATEEDAPTPEEQSVWIFTKTRGSGQTTELTSPATIADVSAEQAGQEPAGGPAGASSSLQASADGGLHAMVRGAALVGLFRARELAGSRIRSRRDSCPDCFQGLDEVPNSDLAARMGDVLLDQVGAPARGLLVRGGDQGFVAALAGLGVDQAAALVLGARLLEIAAAGLCDEVVALPDDFGADL